MPSSCRSLFSCAPPVAIMMFGAPAGGSCLPSRSALLRKFTSSMMKPCSVAGSPLSIFAALDHVGMLLDDVVAGAGRHVVAVGPDGRPRIVGKQRPLEHVAVVRAERVGAGADGVAHRVGALLLGLLAAARAFGAARLLAGDLRLVRGALGRAGLPVARPADSVAPARPLCRGGSFFLKRQPAEDRHDDQPAVGELVVAHDGVAVVELAERRRSP